MFGAHLGLGRHSKALEDSSCEGEGCAVISVMETANARIQIQPLDWVGAWLDIERGSNTVEGADYSGSGIGWSAGLSLAPMPVWGGRWSPRPGLSLRYHTASSESLDEETAELLGSASYSWLETAPLMIVGDPLGGGSAWIGPVIGLEGLQDLTLVEGETELSLALEPESPFSIVIGGEIISRRMSSFLRERSMRLTAGMEGELFGSSSLSIWMGFSY